MKNFFSHQPPNFIKLTYFLLAYFLIWSIAPAFLASSPPIDVSEGINWGSEWQLGYYKHPPFSSWVLFSFYQLFGHVGPYLLSQLYVILTLVLVYQLGRKFLPQALAFLGSILTLAVLYYTYPSLEFNHNVAQFPIWAGLYLTFYNSVMRGKLSDWLWFGVIGGLGMLTKYTVIFLLLPMAIYLLLPKQWSLLKKPQPWLTAIVMLVIFSPHLYWLITHDWLPLSYASGRSEEADEMSGIFAGHLSWLRFVGAQITAHIPLLIMLLLSYKSLLKISDYKKQGSKELALIWYLWAAPVGVLVVLSLIFGLGLRDMWGMPMWSLSGLLAVTLIAPKAQAVALTKLPRALIVWLVLVTALMLIYVGAGDKLRHKPSRMQWSEQAIAAKAQSTWQSISSCPMDSVSGDRWLGSLVAMNSGFPSQMISGAASHSPWMTSQRLQNHGTLVLWQNGDEVELPLLQELSVSDNADFKDSFDNNLPSSQSNQLIKKQGQWQIAWRDPNSKAPLVIDWVAFVPSRCLK